MTSRQLMQSPDRVTEYSAYRRVIHGATYTFRGAAFLAKRPGLWPILALPALVSGGLMLSATALVLLGTPRLIGSLWPAPASGLGLSLWYLMVIVLMVVLSAMAGVVVYALSGLVGTPFWDRLSQEVERISLGTTDEPFDWQVFLGDVRQSLTHSLLAFTIWLSLMTALLSLSLVPAVGPVLELALSTAATGFFLARETMDGAMSRRRMSFTQKLRTLFANKALVQGHGLVTAAILWVPLLNFALMPLSVVGGTLLFLRLEAEGAVPD